VSDNLTFVQDSWASLGPLLSACQSAADAEDPAGGPAAIADLWREADADFLRDEVANAIAESHEGMTQIRDTVRALKEFSHPDSDEMQLGDVNRLVENALMVARNEYKYVADIVKELAEPPPVAPCFVSLINQVLINLIVNSAHAIGEKCRADPGTRGRITVSSRLESDHVVLSVEDDGPGIPEEIRGKIFDPFFTTKEVGKGTGQGLAITHRIVEDHAGKIEVESTPGVGTKISIMLPTRQATQHGAPQLSHA
jgi:signal transduction histidine kinase